MEKLGKIIVGCLLAIGVIVSALHTLEPVGEFVRLLDTRTVTLREQIEEKQFVHSMVSHHSYGDSHAYATLLTREPAQAERIDRLLDLVQDVELRNSTEREGRLVGSVDFFGGFAQADGTTSHYNVMLTLVFFSDDKIHVEWFSEEEGIIEEGWYRLQTPIDAAELRACFDGYWDVDLLNNYLHIESIEKASIRGMNNNMAHYGEIAAIEDTALLRNWLDTQLVDAGGKSAGWNQGHYILTMDCISDGRPLTFDFHLWSNQFYVNGEFYTPEGGFNLWDFVDQFSGWQPAEETTFGAVCPIDLETGEISTLGWSNQQADTNAWAERPESRAAVVQALQGIRLSPSFAGDNAQDYTLQAMVSMVARQADGTFAVADVYFYEEGKLMISQLGGGSVYRNTFYDLTQPVDLQALESLFY